MNEISAVIVGLIVASLIPPAGFASLSALYGDYDLLSIVTLFFALYPFSAVMTIVLGLPAFLLLRPFRPGHWWSVSVVGLLLGVLVSIILRLPGRPNPHDFIIDGPLGAVSAFVFWWIWRRAAPGRRRAPR